MNKDLALRMALEALEIGWSPTYVNGVDAREKGMKAITFLRQAIAEAAVAEQHEKQEPLEYWNAVEGWVKLDEVREHFDSVNCGTIYKNDGEGRVPLYTHPQPKVEQEPVANNRLELIGHADLAINNIYIFNGYGEDVPEGRTPIYAKYQRQKASAPQESDDRIWPVELQGRLRDGEYSYDPEVEMPLFLKAVYWLENSPNTRDKAASKELRRLHEENIRLKECLFQMQEAAKQLATQPKREPLTDKQVNDVRQQYGITSDGRGIKEFTKVRDFVRAIEAAHGIGEKK